MKKPTLHERDLERRPIRSTSTERRAFVVQIFVQLLLEQLHQGTSIDTVSAATSTLSVQLDIWTVFIEWAILLQTKQTALCAKLHRMFFV